ncbi:unnamed protein product, partial [Onchocerca ochengi]|uniref:Col_cuticle_N domain-containing protein n=1 Tax=Onchocerca ochengi TaxID=42157 RepID=A0A182EPG9_ONCOC
MDSDGRIKAYKFVAYSAVSFSIVSILSVVISLPMVYNYVAHVRRQMQHEINFCKTAERLFEQIIISSFFILASGMYRREKIVAGQSFTDSILLKWPTTW